MTEEKKDPKEEIIKVNIMNLKRRLDTTNKEIKDVENQVSDRLKKLRKEKLEIITLLEKLES